MGFPFGGLLSFSLHAFFFPTPTNSTTPAICDNPILMLSLVKGSLGRTLIPQVKNSFPPDYLHFRRQSQIGVPGLPQFP